MCVVTPKASCTTITPPLPGRSGTATYVGMGPSAVTRLMVSVVVIVAAPGPVVAPSSGSAGTVPPASVPVGARL
jgi:hypothetical protein